MITYPMKDAAYASGIPAGFHGAVGGYIGGANATHVWEPRNWRMFHRNRKLPIWVPAPDADPFADAAAFGAALRAHGLAAPRAVVIDVETLVLGELLSCMGTVLRGAGYQPWVYGSAATVFANPPLGGYWVGDWTGQAPALFAPHVRAFQYRANNAHDDSTVKWWPWHHWVKR